MKNLWMFILVLLCINYSQAQIVDYPTIIENLESLELEDTIKIDSLYQISFTQTNNGNALLGLKLGQEALRWSNKYGWEIGKAKSCSAIGCAYLMLGNYYDAINYLIDAKKIYVINENKKGEFECINNMATIFYYNGFYNLSIKEMNTAYLLAKNSSSGDTTGIKGNLGAIYNDIREYDKALNLLFSAAKDNEYKLSIVHDSSKIAELAADAALNYGNIGNSYYFQKKYSRSLKYYVKSLNIYEKFKIKNEFDQNLINYGFAFFNSVDSILEKANFNKVDSALSSIRTGLKYAYNSGSLKSQRDGFWVLAVIYDSIRKYDSAVVNFRKHNEIQDSINTDENRIKIFERFYFSNLELKEELQCLEEKNEEEELIQNTIFIISILFVLLIFVLKYIIYVPKIIINIGTTFLLLGIFVGIELIIHYALTNKVISIEKKALYWCGYIIFIILGLTHKLIHDKIIEPVIKKYLKLKRKRKPRKKQTVNDQY